MIVKRFSLDDVKNVKSMGEFYEVMGYGKDEFASEEVFGKKPYYNNFFLHPETSDKIYKIIKQNNSDNSAAQLAASMDWLDFSPVSSGPRYDELVEGCGRVIRNALYIIQPADDMYKEAPDV